MLGLWRHSPHRGDVLGGGNFSDTGLSRGDTLTLRRLYELPMGFLPQPR
jgi:predicted Zn-dependent protease